MKRITFLLLLATVLCTAFASAQDNQKAGLMGGDKFAIKVQPFTATYLDNSIHFRKLGLDNLNGLNLGLELPSAQQRPYQQYLGNPTLGVGMSVIDLGSEVLGYGVAAYPYLLFSAIRSRHIQFNFKLAAGLGIVTETWYTQEEHDPSLYDNPGAMTNNIFGCHLNAYLSAGANLNIPITRNVALNGEFGYFHMSNGRTCMPNLGANIIYGGVGLVTTFNALVEKEPVRYPNLPYKWALNVTGAAGAHCSWMEVPRYFISSFHVGAVYSVNNWYGVGAGLDVFYNGAVNKNTGRGMYCSGVMEFYDMWGVVEETRPCNTCDGNYTVMEQIRAGIALNNEFRFGLVTAIVDWGLYFYNPSRNLYYDWHFANYENGGAGKRSLFYKAPVAWEEAFHYIRFGLKTRICDNLYLQASAKTHLNICEFVEFGVGYQIPFLKKSQRKGDSIIFHHKKDWWK